MANIRRVSTIGLTVLSVSLFVVSATKTDIIVNTTRSSWISLDYFATIVKVSFGASKCCNVYMSSKSARTETLFDEFVRMYPYEYTLNSRVYDCDNYFMISSSVKELISTTIRIAPTSMTTTKLLILVDDDAVESTGIFNGSIYENAGVNIVAHNGMWTLLNNYLEPRVFKKVPSPHKMRYMQGILNLQGRELQAMAYWNPPFCYLKSTINRTVKGIEREYFTADNESELDGVEVKLFMLIAEQLNFSWTILNSRTDDRFGHEEGTKWIGGMMGKVINKSVDFAFSCMWLTMDKYQYSNPTQPWATVYIHFLVPRPRAVTSFWALTRPFSPVVWSAMVAMIIFQTIYVYTRAWTASDIQKRFRSWTITWTELLGRLVGTWAPKKMQGFELQFQLWHLVGILLVTAYSSSLSARLTNPHYEKRIDTLRDFAMENLSWSSGTGREVPNFTKMFDYSDPYAKQVIELYNRELDDEKSNREILRRNYAVLGNIIGSNFYPKRMIDSQYFTDMRVMEAPIAQFQTTFVVQPWLVQSVNTVILRMQDAGLVQYHLKHVLHRRTERILREVMIEHDTYVHGPKVLKLNSLGAGFAMLAIGLFISTVVFFLELKSFNKKKSMLRSVFHTHESKQLTQQKNKDKVQLRNIF